MVNNVSEQQFVNRSGFYVDVLPLVKPLNPVSFTFAFCKLRSELVQLKVAEDGCFVACVFDGFKASCKDCEFKKFKRQEQPV